MDAAPKSLPQIGTLSAFHATPGSVLEWGDAICIPTGDMDDPERTQLVMMFGGNGDLYIGTCPAGKKGWKMVHLVMSGGHNTTIPTVAQKLAETYRAAFEHLTQNAQEKPCDGKAQI